MPCLGTRQIEVSRSDPETPPQSRQLQECEQLLDNTPRHQRTLPTPCAEPAPSVRSTYWIHESSMQQYTHIQGARWQSRTCLVTRRRSSPRVCVDGATPICRCWFEEPLALSSHTVEAAPRSRCLATRSRAPSGRCAVIPLISPYRGVDDLGNMRKPCKRPVISNSATRSIDRVPYYHAKLDDRFGVLATLEEIRQVVGNDAQRETDKVWVLCQCRCCDEDGGAKPGKGALVAIPNHAVSVDLDCRKCGVLQEFQDCGSIR